MCVHRDSLGRGPSGELERACADHLLTFATTNTTTTIIAMSRATVPAQASASRSNATSNDGSNGDAVGALRARLHSLDAQLADVNKLVAALADPAPAVKASPPVPIPPQFNTSSKDKAPNHPVA